MIELINVYRKYPRLYKVIMYINTYNPGTINYYHNDMHMFEVFEQCVDIVDNLDILIKEEELYTAALFHDFDHIGKMGQNYNDGDNIKKAIDSFLSYSKYKYSEEFINDTIKIIKSTQYPGIIKDEDKTIEEIIISDSDMTAQLRNNVLISIYGGLNKEMNNDINTFFVNQLKFIESLKFKTEYCRNKWEYLKPIRIEELRNLAICCGMSI